MLLIPGRDRSSCFPQHVLLTAPQVAPRTEASISLMHTNICSVKEQANTQLLLRYSTLCGVSVSAFFSLTSPTWLSKTLHKHHFFPEDPSSLIEPSLYRLSLNLSST